MERVTANGQILCTILIHSHVILKSSLLELKYYLTTGMVVDLRELEELILELEKVFAFDAEHGSSFLVQF